MNRIAFRNFRKFKDYTSLELYPITFFVGENNSGKSTITKGLILLYEYLSEEPNFDLRRGSTKVFCFNRNKYTHIETFKRALCRSHDEELISIAAEFDGITINVDILPSPEGTDNTFGIIKELSIDFINYQTKIVYNYQKRIITFVFNGLKKEISYSGIISYLGNPDLKDIMREVTRLIVPHNAEDASEKDVIEYQDYIDGWITNYDFPKGKNFLKVLYEGKQITIDEYDFLQNQQSLLNEINQEIENHHLEYGFRDQRPFEYIYAHGITQDSIYCKNDSNNYFAQTVWEFSQIIEERAFIRRWMKEFQIGDDYELQSVCGEALVVKILDQDGNVCVLADKGIGAIRLMLMLFRLEIICYKNRHDEKRTVPTTVIIEEPEQNLHPSLQSKLADFFLEVSILRNDKFSKIHFIIETHSEYLIRQTQVLVSQNFDDYRDRYYIEGNPFKVYYFPADGDPYDMGYDENGLFINQFGDGFMNEASRLHLRILNNAKNKK